MLTFFALTHFYSMPALPTADKKLLELRKRLCDEDLGECFDRLWRAEIRVERSKRPGSENARREVLVCFGTEYATAMSWY